MPFEFQLGVGGVIPGWDQGLVGSQAGGRYQLDIPSDLAYGDADQGEVIKAGDALSFVIDVLQVISPSTAEDEPTVSVEPSAGAAKVTSTDLEVGTGAVAEAGSYVYIDLAAYRGDMRASSTRASATAARSSSSDRRRGDPWAGHRDRGDEGRGDTPRSSSPPRSRSAPPGARTSGSRPTPI